MICLQGLFHKTIRVVILCGKFEASNMIKYSERWVEFNICFKILFMGLLKMDPDPEGPVMPPVQSLGARTGLPRVQLAGSGFACLLLTCASKRSSHVGPGFLFSIVPLFSFSLTFSLHADKSLCFTSPKTPSSSWVSHLSALRSWSLLQLTLFSLLASCLRAGHTLRFLLYRSSSVQCKINTV